MSRGLGSVQVGLLAIIQQQDKSLDTYDLARRFYDSGAEGPCMTISRAGQTICRLAATITAIGHVARSDGGRTKSNGR